MTYIKHFCIIIMAMLLPLGLASCGDDEPYMPNGPIDNPGGGGQQGDELNQYESNLIGSYMTNDDPSDVFYLVLYEDHTGYYVTVREGESNYGEQITWEADASNVYFTYVSDNAEVSMGYEWRNGCLYLGDYVLVVNNGTVPGWTNQYEQALAGSYVTADGTFYLVLDENLTGYYMAKEGDGWYSEYVSWQADADKVYFTYTLDGVQINMDYQWRGGYLYLGDYVLMANTGSVPSILNEYEAQLVGSYKTFDDPAYVVYIVLNDDRTGYYVINEQGKDNYSESITWQADANSVYFTYVSDGEKVSMQYQWSGGILTMGDYVLVANTGLVPMAASSIAGSAHATRSVAVVDRLRTARHTRADGSAEASRSFRAKAIGRESGYVAVRRFDRR